MRKRKLLVVLAGVSALILGIPGSSAGGNGTDIAADVPTAFTSSPAAGAAGTTITFSGTGCPDANRVFVGLYSGVPPVLPAVPPTSAALVSTTLTPSGGAWNGSFVVPAGTAVGALFVFADCVAPALLGAGVGAASHDGALGLVDYIPNVFVVISLPTGGGAGATAAAPTATPGPIGDLGAAIPVSGVPRFTG
jgi:hypothetical protein